MQGKYYRLAEISQLNSCSYICQAQPAYTRCAIPLLLLLPIRLPTHSPLLRATCTCCPDLLIFHLITTFCGMYKFCFIILSKYQR